MIYGEVGKLPIKVTADKYLISYWLRLLNKAHIIYMIALNLFLVMSTKHLGYAKLKI